MGVQDWSPLNQARPHESRDDSASHPPSFAVKKVRFVLSSPSSAVTRPLPIRSEIRSRRERLCPCADPFRVWRGAVCPLKGSQSQVSQRASHLMNRKDTPELMWSVAQRHAVSHVVSVTIHLIAAFCSALNQEHNGAFDNLISELRKKLRQ